MSHETGELQVPEAGLVTRAVVGDDAFAGDSVSITERSGSRPESGRGGALFVVEDLGIDQPGSVIERGVDEPIADLTTPRRFACVSTPAGAMSAAIRDRGDLLHVHVDQLARPVALITTNWCRGRPVTAIEPADPFDMKDPLDRRRATPVSYAM